MRTIKVNYRNDQHIMRFVLFLFLFVIDSTHTLIIVKSLGLLHLSLQYSPGFIRVGFENGNFGHLILSI